MKGKSELLKKLLTRFKILVCFICMGYVVLAVSIILIKGVSFDSTAYYVVATLFLLIFFPFLSILIKIESYINDCKSIEREWGYIDNSLDFIEKLQKANKVQSTEEEIDCYGVRISLSSISEPTLFKQSEQLNSLRSRYKYLEEPQLIRRLRTLLRC